MLAGLCCWTGQKCWLQRMRRELLLWGTKRRMNKVRMAVVGVGAFGKNPLPVLSKSQRVELAAAVDLHAAPRDEAQAAHRREGLSDFRRLAGRGHPAGSGARTPPHS